jgi:hypothetical protein
MRRRRTRWRSCRCAPCRWQCSRAAWTCPPSSSIVPCLWQVTEYSRTRKCHCTARTHMHTHAPARAHASARACALTATRAPHALRAALQFVRLLAAPGTQALCENLSVDTLWLILSKPGKAQPSALAAMAKLDTMTVRARTDSRNAAKRVALCCSTCCGTLQRVAPRRIVLPRSGFAQQPRTSTGRNGLPRQPPPGRHVVPRRHRCNTRHPIATQCHRRQPARCNTRARRAAEQALAPHSSATQSAHAHNHTHMHARTHTHSQHTHTQTHTHTHTYMCRDLQAMDRCDQARRGIGMALRTSAEFGTGRRHVPTRAHGRSLPRFPARRTGGLGAGTTAITSPLRRTSTARADPTAFNSAKIARPGQLSVVRFTTGRDSQRSAAPK